MNVIDFTEDDIVIVKRLIMFPLVMDVLERDIKTIMESDIKMKEVYARSLRKVQNEANRDFHNDKQLARKRGIKVYDQIRTKDRLEAKYLCRGYHSDFTMLWFVAKSQIQIMLSGYLNIDLTDDTTNPEMIK